MKRWFFTCILFIVLALLFVYPSFYTRPPIDCLAGCFGLKGVPVSYYTVIGGTLVSTSGVDFYINYLNLAIDLALWFAVSFALVNPNPKKYLRATLLINSVMYAALISMVLREGFYGAAVSWFWSILIVDATGVLVGLILLRKRDGEEKNIRLALIINTVPIVMFIAALFFGLPPFNSRY